MELSRGLGPPEDVLCRVCGDHAYPICGAPKYTRRAAGIWSTNELMRTAELELAGQAETSYKRIVQDQQAGAPATKAGASVTLERA